MYRNINLSIVLMNECYHGEAWRAGIVVAIITEARIKHEQWLVLVEYAAQEPYHFLLGRLLIARVIRSTAVGTCTIAFTAVRG